MNTPPFLPAVLIAALVLAACSKNPADDVARARVEDPSGDSASKSGQASSQARRFVFTDASSIRFVGSKVTGSHEGGFKSFTGHVSVAGDALAPGPHEVVIDMESTWADHPKLEAHLKSADFFDVETFPQAIFKLSSLENAPGTSHTLSGEFTLHGTTKSISFPSEITAIGGGYRLVAEFSINRRDFGIRYPGKPDDLIRDEVVIMLDIVAIPG